MADDKKELLAGIMCHELGHWLEISDRAADFCGNTAISVECFANSIGHELCQNTSYNFQVRVDNYAKFVKKNRDKVFSRLLAVILCKTCTDFYENMLDIRKKTLSKGRE